MSQFTYSILMIFFFLIDITVYCINDFILRFQVKCFDDNWKLFKNAAHNYVCLKKLKNFNKRYTNWNEIYCFHIFVIIILNFTFQSLFFLWNSVESTLDSLFSNKIRRKWLIHTVFEFCWFFLIFVFNRIS